MPHHSAGRFYSQWIRGSDGIDDVISEFVKREMSLPALLAKPPSLRSGSRKAGILLMLAPAITKGLASGPAKHRLPEFRSEDPLWAGQSCVHRSRANNSW